ncbi:MAG: hypothetical protein ACR2LY_05665 [Thermoleophilaceae bacterium]
MAGAGPHPDGLRASAERPLRVVFFMRHQVYTRNFESTLRLLAERGHSVHVGFDRSQTDPPGAPIRAELIERLSGEYPGRITYGRVPWREEGLWNLESGWFRLEAEVGRAIDYLRYLDPRYRDAPKLRRRAEKKAGGGLGRLARLPLVRTPTGLRGLRRSLSWVERSLPTRAAVNRFLRERDPDIVLVTPLVDIASPQGAYLRCAKGLGVRTGLCVHSWDNLTNKGLIRDAPDFVTVWNEAQRDEAVDLHGVPREGVVVTGAPGYDHWFDWSPSRDGDEFRREVGLSEGRPFLLYLCSSYFIAPREVDFVREWLAHLRTSESPRLREVGVLIRPHPKNVEQWRDADLDRAGGVAVWPRTGADPLSRQAKADFFDSMFHCVAVVGVNTSALIESAIVGRPAFTVLAPEFRDTQSGTLHFHHLTDEGAGLLTEASSLDEHAGQLDAVLSGRADYGERLRSFVKAFVRPRGLDRAATPALVATVEQACAQPPPAPRRAGASTAVLRAAVFPAALLLALRPVHNAYVVWVGLRHRWEHRGGRTPDLVAVPMDVEAPGENGAASGLPEPASRELGDPVARSGE